MMSLANGTTKHMKPGTGLLAIAAFVLLLAGPSGAQGLQDTLKRAQPAAKTVENVAPDDSRIILAPVQIPGEQSQSRIRVRRPIRTSGTLGTYGFGFEVSLPLAGTPWHGSLFVGSVTDPQRRISNAEYITLAGLSAGYRRPLNRPGTAGPGGAVLGIPGDGVQYYLQVGPGLGMGGVGRVNGELELHPYVYTDGALGAVIPVSQNGGDSFLSGASFYTEFGGLVAWFPTLTEMQFIAGPHITFGFHLFSGSDIPAIDY